MTQEENAASATRKDSRAEQLRNEWRQWKKNKKKVWYLC